MNNNEKREIMKELEEIQYYLELGVKHLEFDKLEWSLSKLHALTLQMNQELKDGR